jgi:hypothetical protein
MEDGLSALILSKVCPLRIRQQYACWWHNRRVYGYCVLCTCSGDHDLDPLKDSLMTYSREEDPLFDLLQK